MTVYLEENLEPRQTFETDFFAKIVKGFKLQLSVQELHLRYLNEILIKTYENFLKTLTEDSFEVFLKMYEKRLQHRIFPVNMAICKNSGCPLCKECQESSGI